MFLQGPWRHTHVVGITIAAPGWIASLIDLFSRIPSNSLLDSTLARGVERKNAVFCSI